MLKFNSFDADGAVLRNVANISSQSQAFRVLERYSNETRDDFRNDARPGRGAMRPVHVDVAVDAGAALAEGPVWDQASQRLIWVDIVGRAVHHYDPASGTDTFVELDDMAGVALRRGGGGLVVAIGRSFAVLEPDGRLERIVEVPKVRAPAG